MAQRTACEMQKPRQSEAATENESSPGEQDEIRRQVGWPSQNSIRYSFSNAYQWVSQIILDTIPKLG